MLDRILGFWCYTRVQKSGYRTHDLMYRLVTNEIVRQAIVSNQGCFKKLVVVTSREEYGKSKMG